MVDNKNPSDQKPHDFEEEFDFDTNEIFENNSSQIQDNPPNTISSSSFKEKAKWPFLIGLVVIAFLGWKLYDIMFPSTAESELERVASEESRAISSAQQSARQTPGVAPQSAAPATPAVPPPATLPAAPAVVTPIPEPMPIPAPQSMAAANPAMSQTQEEMKQLENTVNQVMDALNKMDQKISLIGREFFAVSDNVNRLSQEVAELKTRRASPAPAVKRPTPVPKKPVRRPERAPVSVETSSEEAILEEPTRSAPPKPTHSNRKSEFVIHAIIPGRVWLRAPDGSTFTASTGDVIPGYGKAMVIDAPSASVVTSSGVVIR